jgi:hypothetical protein
MPAPASSQPSPPAARHTHAGVDSPGPRPAQRPHAIARALVLTLAALGTACAGVAAPPAPTLPGPTLPVAAALGSRQCEGGGTAPAAWAQRLREAGVTVSAVGCGHDGRMRPAVCGAPDGQLMVLEIDSTQLPAARALGFRPLSEWPGATRRPCPLDNR